MTKLSAGIMVFRRRAGALEVFLVHPGGPFWAKKDVGAWSIPKGEYAQSEDPWKAAQREFQEEIGQVVPRGTPLPLGEVKYGNKVVVAWAIEGDIDSATVMSNTFTMEWPPKSGKQQTFPEVDKAEWFEAKTAVSKVVSGQVPFIARLTQLAP